MFSKILVTLTVIVTAFFFLRQRHQKEETSNNPRVAQETAARKAAEKSEFSADLRFAAYMTVVLMVGLGALLYYFRWQDDHELLTVTLHRDNQAQPISYQVYKYQLQDRSFITVDGTAVTVASNERMEIFGLD